MSHGEQAVNRHETWSTPPYRMGICSDLRTKIRWAGERVASYQASDWVTPLPPNALLARGATGDEHIDSAPPTIAAGDIGDVEVGCSTPISGPPRPPRHW